MDAKTKIIIKAVVIPLAFLILILTIIALFILKCRMDRKKDKRENLENLSYSFAPSEQWQTPPQPHNQHWQAAQHSHNQWPMNQYQMATAQMEKQKPVPVAYPVQYQSQLDSRSQA